MTSCDLLRPTASIHQQTTCLQQAGQGEMTREIDKVRGWRKLLGALLRFNRYDVAICAELCADYWHFNNSGWGQPRWRSSPENPFWSKEAKNIKEARCVRYVWYVPSVYFHFDQEKRQFVFKNSTGIGDDHSLNIFARARHRRSSRFSKFKTPRQVRAFLKYRLLSTRCLKDTMCSAMNTVKAKQMEQIRKRGIKQHQPNNQSKGETS